MVSFSGLLLLVKSPMKVCIILLLLFSTHLLVSCVGNLYFTHTVYTHSVLFACFYTCLYYITCTAAADYSLVALKIPLGDRPDLEAIDMKKAEGLKEVVDLMKMCWDKNPSKRPNLKGMCLGNTKM